MFYHVVQPSTELIFARLQTSVCNSRLAKQNLVNIGSYFYGCNGMLAANI